MEKEILLVNVYGPNNDNPGFYETLRDKIKAYNNNNIVAVGDWNLVMDPNMDYNNYVNINNPNAREALEKITVELGIADVWREDNPESRRYTWRKRTPFKQSRLDFFLLSDYLFWYYKDSDILPGYRSDHSMVTLALEFGKQKVKKGFWKFNTSLLKDKKYADEINAEILNVLMEYAADHYDKTLIHEMDRKDIELKVPDKVFLDFLLMKIRGKTIAYATMKKKLKEEKEKQLIKDIENIERHQKSEIDLTELENKNAELKEIRQQKMEGILLRCKSRWITDGEKISKYFCNLEKRNYISKQMTKLVDSNGLRLEDENKIISEVTSFYKNLYSERDTEDCNIQAMVKELPKLSDTEKCSLEGEITLEEAGYALKSMNNEKSPGTDGFSAEFFKFFWNQIGPFVVRSLNEAYQDGELSATQKEGLITCIPKGDKPKEYIKNWRPISLLNVVYKIGSSCIANRIKQVLPSLISEDQTGFMANRYMGDNIRLICDLISYLNMNNLPGLLLCIDFEKAFDSLSWTFMHKVLRAYGFGESLCRWITTFYTNAKSTVIVNGNTSDWISIKRGCRQGDPVSPYLFILCAEILSIMIKEESVIKGIQIQEIEYKIAQFADDTQLISKGDRTSFEQSIAILEKFGKVSGLFMNTDKSQAIWLGSMKKSPIRYSPHLRMIWNPDKFKILGIWLTQDLSNIHTINYNDKLSEIKLLFNIWSKRTITPIGRIAVLKSLVLSKLIHLWILLPDPPDLFIQNLQKLCFQFVWGGNRDRISRKTAIKTVKQGGVNVPDIQKYIHALKLQWIRKLKTATHKWKNIVLELYPFLKKIECYGPSIFPIEDKKSVFWAHVFKAYRLFHLKVKPRNQYEILAEPVFYNENIKVANSIIKYRKLISCGLYAIRHFLKDNHGFKTYEEFTENLTFTINFVTYRGWISAIKQYIRKSEVSLSTPNMLQRETFFSTFDKILNIHKGAKGYYEILTDNNSKPTCCSKWENKLNVQMPWDKVFHKIHKIKDVSLKWLQLRIVHRIIATNIMLNAMGVTDTTNCVWCDNARDSIEHVFWSCQYVCTFWNALQRLLNEKCDNAKNLKLSQNLILFSVDDHIKTDNILDLIILLSKRYIYKCKIQKHTPDINVFKIILKARYSIEKYIARINYNISTFNADWYFYKFIFPTEG